MGYKKMRILTTSKAAPQASQHETRFVFFCRYQEMRVNFVAHFWHILVTRILSSFIHFESHER